MSAGVGAGDSGLDPLVERISALRRRFPAQQSALVAITGIDGSARVGSPNACGAR